MTQETAVFRKGAGEWDVETVPPRMNKFGTIKQKGSDVRIFVSQAKAGQLDLFSQLLGSRTFGSLGEAMDAIAAVTKGSCRLIED